MQGQDTAFLICYLADLAVTVCFIIFCVNRCYILSKRGSQKNQLFNQSFVIKLGLLGLFVGTDLIEFILSRVAPGFWLNRYEQLSLILIAPILAILSQIYAIILEHKTRTRCTRWHQVYWIYQILIATAIIVILFVYGQADVGLIIPFVQIAIMLVLLVYATFIEDEFFEKESTTGILEKDITVLQTERDRPDLQGTQMTKIEKQPIYVEFNSVPVIHFKTTVQYEFTIAVYCDGSLKPYVIQKFEQDFTVLATQMESMFPESEEAKLPQGSKIKVVGQLGDAQSKVKLYEEYLIKLLKSVEYYVQPLLQFLQIEGQFRIRLVDMNRRKTIDRSTMSHEEQSMCLEQVKFLTVSYNSREAIVQHKDYVRFTCVKTHRQIEQYHSKLIREGKLKKDMLDNRTKASYQELIEYLCNSPKHWIDFSIWFGINKHYQNKIHRVLDMWYHGVKSQVETMGHEMVASKDGQTYTLYNFMLVRVSNDLKKTTIIKKRFSEFSKVYQSVVAYYRDKKYTNFKIPSLPPKVAAFGSKTSPKSRQKSLQTFLRKIIVLQNINHCVKLLDFLQSADGDDMKVIYTTEDGSNNIQEELKIQNFQSNIEESINGRSLDIDSLAMPDLR